MIPKTLQFSGDRRVFDLSTSVCANLECGCGEFCFHLREVRGAFTAKKLLNFDVRVQADTWTEAAAPPRSAEVKAMADELLLQYPEDERVSMQSQIAKRKTAAHRLKTYRIAADVIATSKLVFFGEVVSELGGLPANDFSFAWRFSWLDTEFYALDGYCPDPECQCGHVYLHFFELMPSAIIGEPVTVEERCIATVSLEGDVAIGERFGCSKGAAEGIVDAWKHHGDVMSTLRWRYDKIKEIARRTPRPARPSAEPLALPIKPFGTLPGKPGRNDPCPCGSGAKYKKCCGR